MNFFHNFVRRRLCSLLRPWTQEEPGLLLELGLIDSLATFQNLRFDISLLNQLLDGPSLFSFQEFTVEYLSIHFSTWSAPAFKIEVSGVHVTLSARLTEEGSPRGVRTAHDTAAREMKKVLSSIDPEGCFLHNILERILFTDSQRSKLENSFSNLVLRHSNIQMLGISVRVCLPVLSDPLECVLKIKGLRSEAKNCGRGSFLRGSLSAVLFTLDRSSLNVSGYGFKIGYKKNNDSKRLIDLDDLFMSIDLLNLRPVDLVIRISELCLSFGSADLPIFLALANLSSKECKSIRNGQHLWKVAAGKIGLMTSSPAFSFHNLVGVVICWLRYVNAYGCLLSSIGYSGKRLKKSCFGNILGNKRLFASARHKWEMICEIEKVLPAEAIAQARRVARSSARLKFQDVDDIYEESFLCRHLYYLCKIIWVLAYVCRFMYKKFQSMVQIFSLRRVLTNEPETVMNKEVGSEQMSPGFQAVMSLKKVFITYCPEKPNSITKQLDKRFGCLRSDFVSLCFSIDGFLLMYSAGFSDQSFSVSCGKLTVESSNSNKARSLNSFSKDPSSSIEGKHMHGDMGMILYVKPAQWILPLDKCHSGGRSEGALHLQNFLREMWLNWRNTHSKLEENDIEYSRNPCFLCEIKSCLTYEEMENQVSGLWKFSMALGKLDFTLEHISLLSMVLLLWQIQWAQTLTANMTTVGILSNSLEASTAGPQVQLSMEKALNCLHPEGQIQVGIFVAGPQVQLSVEKDVGGEEVDDVMTQKDQLLLFDFHDIEFVTWSSSKSGMKSLKMPQRPNNAKSDWSFFKKLQPIDIPRLNYEKYASQGWNSLSSYLGFDGFDCSFCNMAERKWSQIFVLRPVSICFSSLRQYVYSFSEAVTAFSTGLDGLVEGLIILSKIDDTNAFFQMLRGLFSKLSHGLNGVHLVGHSPGQVSAKSDVVPMEHEIEGILSKTLFVVDASIRLKSIDVILHVPMADKKVERFTEISDFRIWSCIRETYVEVSCTESRLQLSTGLCELQSVLFRYQDNIWKSSNESISRSLLFQLPNRLSEACLSSCTLRIYMDCSSSSASENTILTPGDSSKCITASSSKTNESRASTVQSHGLVEKLDSVSPVPNSTDWIRIDLVLTDLLIARCSTKNALVGAHQPLKFLSSVSVGRKFRSVSWEIQGDFFILEPVALVLFTEGFSSYLRFIWSKVSVLQSSALVLKKAEADSGLSELNVSSQQAQWKFLEAFSLDVIQLSLEFISDDQSGGLRELVLEINLHIGLEVADREQKFVCEISRISVLSQILEKVEKEIRSGQFSSRAFSEPSYASGAPLQSFQGKDVISSVDNTSAFGDFDSLRESPTKCDAPEKLYSGFKSYILEDLRVFLSAMKPENDSHHFNHAWAGSCSILGFDITISLSELQMALSILSSFSGLPRGETTKMLQTQSSYNETRSCFESMVPDGAIVAIQDVHQHLFFTVEGERSKYTLAGTLHYSLVGERALFRVRYHKQRSWKSSVLWFSLTSLCAKNDKGEPLRLNCNSGSDIVDISGTYDNAPTLWRASVCESESYKGDIDQETYCKLVKDTVYLVNKKNDSAVAFADGFPEFVRKPGNPFKFRVIHDSLVIHDSTSEAHPEAYKNEGQIYLRNVQAPFISITIDGVAVTVVHELLETRDRTPLLRGSINIMELTLQMLSSKARIIGTSKVSVLYFDAQKNQWRELVSPVEVSLFYRFTFHSRGSEHALHKIPTHIYCRTGKLGIFLTELSLDMLLFVIGKLGLAGPFSVKASALLANRCEIENQTVINLLCSFNEKQTVVVSGKQAASAFLQYSALENHSPAASPVASIQLSAGNFRTSSISLSLLEARTLAWRTRLVSFQDSRSHPGPFIVVDVKKRSEDGLSVSVSPLIRIHNETRLPLEIRFRRADQKEDEFASVSVKPGDTIDESVAAISAISSSGGLKKALTSLAVGNFLLSFRPESLENLFTDERSLKAEWSEELRGEKAVHLSGVFEKLCYGVKRALSIESVKCSFTTAYCSVTSKHLCVGNVHFLIQSIGRDVPIVQPDLSSNVVGRRNSSIALREQKEIFLLPTVQVSNFLSSEVTATLTTTGQFTSNHCDNINRQATVQSGTTVDFYVNPAMIYFSITLTVFGSSCKPVNSGQWLKELKKHKNEVESLDVDLDFAGGKYYAYLRLSRGKRGILEAAVFTSYTLVNDSDCSLLFFSPDQRPPSREDLEKFDHGVPPEFGLYLPKKSKGSWFSRSHRVCVKLVEGHGASEAKLDLDALSGFTEICLETKDESGFRNFTKFGLSVQSISNKMPLPSQIVTIVPRHLVINESEETIFVHQGCLQDDTAGIITIKSKQRAMLRLQEEITKRKEFHVFENFIRKHGSEIANPLIFIRFRLNDANASWSGPLCITSIGHFSIKFRKQSNESDERGQFVVEFASVNVTEEGSTLLVRFHKPPNDPLPYRVENFLHSASITYYQKDSSELEVLSPGSRADYAWDDITLPHKLVIMVNDVNPLREVSLDKVRPWKPFFKMTQHRGLTTHLMLEKKAKSQRTNSEEFGSRAMVNVGYEVYADGLTRVLRISEVSDSRKGDVKSHSHSKIQFRVTNLGIHLLEPGKQDTKENSMLSFMPILVARLENIGLQSMYTDQHKFSQICVQALNVEQKREGAPFAALLRGHRSDSCDADDCQFKFVFVLVSNSSSMTQVKYSSIVLQPIDLNLDEETLMRIVPFWRSSLSTSPESRQFYFDHFEIHPIKIVANFVAGNSYSSYNSAQETLRSLLHSVAKVPQVKNMVVELNGVLVTHALITVRELLVRCAKHYSWYSMRAIYIAKGSPLLPPAFASMFDDFASSSLDAFFDPSQGLVNIPGLTLGTFKLLSKFIDSKGLSGTRRYLGDLGKTLRTAGSNVMFAAVTEVSDSVLKGAEVKGLDGLVSGFQQGVLKLAMEPSVIGTALMEGGPDRTIKLDRSPGVNELYIEGYLQAMLDTIYRQEYLRVKVIDDQVFLKNLPPSNSLIDEIMERVKDFLESRGLLRGDPSTSRPLRRLQGEREWKLGPTVMTLCEHLFVSYAIRVLRQRASKLISNMQAKPNKETEAEDGDSISTAIVPSKPAQKNRKVSFLWKSGIGKFVLSGIVAYIDGRLCRCIPNPIARRIVSGFLLSFLDGNNEQ